MSALVLDGKALSKQLEAELAQRVAVIKERRGGEAPALATILVGDEPLDFRVDLRKIFFGHGGGS